MSTFGARMDIESADDVSVRTMTHRELLASFGLADTPADDLMGEVYAMVDSGEMTQAIADKLGFPEPPRFPGVAA